MILQGDCREVLRTLDADSVQCCVTSPPYWGLRDYGVAGQLGLEPTPDEYVANMVEVFREVRRVLRPDGVVWLNLGDSYAANRSYQVTPTKWDTLDFGNSNAARVPDGLKPKDLVGIPWRVAFALQADGWWLRSEVIWAKPNPMPESVTDRPTKSHEQVFLLTKSERYYYDADAIAEPVSASSLERWGGSGTTRRGSVGKAKERNDFTGERGEDTCGFDPRGRNARSVWTIATKPYSEAHFATFPPELARRCILAGSRPAGRRCDCDEVIRTPTGNGSVDDPSIVTGRAGMNRPRRDNEGTRPITKREQRWEAEQIKNSPHRDAMEAICGSPFAHYIRTDDSGARPLPPDIRADFQSRGWITEAPPCPHPIEPADTVLDPFNGAGTTGLVAQEHNRQYIGIELNPEYIDISERRLAQNVLPLLDGAA